MAIRQRLCVHEMNTASPPPPNLPSFLPSFNLQPRQGLRRVFWQLSLRHLRAPPTYYFIFSLFMFFSFLFPPPAPPCGLPYSPTPLYKTMSLIPLSLRLLTATISHRYLLILRPHCIPLSSAFGRTSNDSLTPCCFPLANYFVRQLFLCPAAGAAVSMPRDDGHTLAATYSLNPHTTSSIVQAMGYYVFCYCSCDTAIQQQHYRGPSFPSGFPYAQKQPRLMTTLLARLSAPRNETNPDEKPTLTTRGRFFLGS